MIIYRCIFEKIINSLIELGNNDDLVEKIRDYVGRNDMDSHRSIIENKLLGDWKKENINYLCSKNIQVTLYYYLFCFNEDELIEEFMGDLICFDDNFHIYEDVLNRLYSRISENIGYLNMDCSGFIENEESFHDIFKTREEVTNYLNS